MRARFLRYVHLQRERAPTVVSLDRFASIVLGDRQTRPGGCVASSGGIGGSSPSHWHLFGDEGHSVKWHSCRTCDLVLSYRPEAILLPVDTFQEAEMATGDADALGPLEFTSYDVTDLASLAPPTFCRHRIGAGSMYFDSRMDLPTSDRLGTS